ncbi:ABC transporter ATP-binding protein [Vibrio mangrovi]|uniref:ABC transporter ATP-binding protein n=1 Tax=Vibrio mangrovi TaxID=474394 RepID=A0A1Y6IXR0_9VIBR|nr:ABC transporter ATP-binding protein [Vibrio mangrovi]MDW6002264.1 ABC transporter ATP-binding protein [Vibrio mangrovi]SMS01610.1 Iron import ATP-binding/permease protein IrtA [Vibrio mangrovi]
MVKSNKQDSGSGDALRRLRQPVKNQIWISLLLGGIGSLTTLMTFVGLAELGKLLLLSSIPDVGAILQFGLLVISGISLGWFCTGLALWVSHLADNKLQASLRRALVRRLAQVPLGWYSDKNSGAVRKAVQDDLEDLHHLIAHHYVDVASATVLPLGGIVYLIYLDWHLALLAVATLPVYVITYGWMLYGFKDKMQQLDRSFTAVSSAIVEFVQGIEVVKIFGQQGGSHARYQQAVNDFRQRYIGWVSPLLRIEAITSMAISVPVIALTSLIGGSWMVRHGWVSGVDLLAELLVAMVIPQSLMVLNQSITLERKAVSASERVSELLNARALPQAEKPEEPGSADIHFDQVSFSFSGDQPVLKNINLFCPAGTVTALVGPSGSGKSTLAKLVPRFYDVTAGTLRIGGVDVRNIASDCLYRHVGFVLQDVQLLRMSVRDNFRLAKADASQQEIERVARLALLHDRIMSLPRGYDSVIEEDALFSGGEAQRFSIARTLLADTPIVILDEATAHADVESEAMVQQALAAVTAGRTVLVIAHRLPTIQEVDQIVVLDQGEIKEQGTHAELLDCQGIYFRLWQSLSVASGSILKRGAGSESEAVPDVCGDADVPMPVKE